MANSSARDAPSNRDYPNCFGCGKENPWGLQLRFRVAGERVFTEFTPLPRHEGWPNIVHGGVISTLLYEVMENWPFVMHGTVTMMRSMDVKLISPARVGEKLSVFASLKRREDSDMWIESEITCESRTVARGKAELVFTSKRRQQLLGI